MDEEELEAFVDAYGNVAHATSDEVRAFVRKRNSGCDEETLYNEFADYTSIVDAMCVWNCGQEFANKKKAAAS
jgi:hypothetical protein